jgi:hypothetical protein
MSLHEISSFIQLYEKEWATLYRLTTSTSQVNSESEQYRRDFATFLSHDCVKCDFLLASLMETFPNEVDNISTKDTSSFQEVKNKFLNLHSASNNSDLAHHTFGNKKNQKSKKGTKCSGSSSSKPGPSSYSKDTVSSSKAKTCTWCTKYHSSKANGHGWHECSKLKEFNKSVPKDKGNGKEQHIAGYNLDTDSEVEGLIHQDAEVSTIAKWIFDSGASTHMILDVVLF